MGDNYLSTHNQFNRNSHGYARRGNGRANIYRRWQHMIQRCHNSNDRDYARYGAKGIKVCERWRMGEGLATGFECFFNDMGEPPTRQHSIDRIDVYGPYAPENARWATARTQANNRTSTRMLTINGETKALSYWAEQYGLGQKTILYRIKIGWDHYRAVTTPSQRNRSNTRCQSLNSEQPYPSQRQRS